MNYKLTSLILIAFLTSLITGCRTNSSGWPVIWFMNNGQTRSHYNLKAQSWWETQNVTAPEQVSSVERPASSAGMPMPPTISKVSKSSPLIVQVGPPAKTVALSSSIVPVFIQASTDLSRWTDCTNLTAANLTFSATAAQLFFRGIPAANLHWEASPSPDVTGYKIYMGPASRNYTNAIFAGNVTQFLVQLPGATNYLAATTITVKSGSVGANAVQESDFSNEVMVKAVPPTLFISQN